MPVRAHDRHCLKVVSVFACKGSDIFCDGKEKQQLYSVGLRELRLQLPLAYLVK